MPYRIQEIEGIGPSYARKLAVAGIRTTDHLLTHCGSARGRKSMSDTVGIKESQLLQWVNMADLMRIRGVGEEYSELLEAAGVDTVKELKSRRPDNLAAKMAEVNAKRKLVRRVPTEIVVRKWVQHARTLAPKISH